MVALKLMKEMMNLCNWYLKQERRGGIETDEGLRVSDLQIEKQERRGGIETATGGTKPQADLPGSRNAVVALKQRNSSHISEISKRKQERRGGIETQPPEPGHELLLRESRNAVVALKRRSWGRASAPLPRKQERRGGIETAMAISECRGIVTKAGTPWWH